MIFQVYGTEFQQVGWDFLVYFVPFQTVVKYIQMNYFLKEPTYRAYGGNLKDQFRVDAEYAS